MTVQNKPMTQEELWFNDFCKRARYHSECIKPYSIMVNGKTIRSKDMGDLFEQYLKIVRSEEK